MLRLRPLAAALSAALLAPLSQPAAAAAFQWTGAAANTNWNLANNWLNLDLGAVSGFPTIADTAAFTLNAAVAGGAAGGLSIAPAVTVTLGGGASASTTLTGTFDNGGVLSFVADGVNHVAGVVDQRIFIPAGNGLLLTGAGQINLGGSETGFEGEGPTSLLTNDVNHSIVGGGTFEDLSLVNHGAIAANGGTLQLNAVALSGFGSVFVTGAGTLRLSGGTSVSGNTLFGGNGTLVNGDALGGSLANLTLAGQFTLGGGSSSSLTVDGTVVNNAELTFVADGIDHVGGIVDQRLFVAGGSSVTLEGTGRIVMNGDETGLEGAGLTSQLTNSAGHTLAGNGVIEQLVVTNHGFIDVSGGQLILNEAAIDGTGIINVAADGGLTLQNGAGVSGGTLFGAGGDLIGVIGGAGGTLSDLTLVGSFVVGGGTSSSIRIAGTLVNDAELAFVADGIDHLGGLVDQRFFIAGGTVASLEGGGRVQLNGAQTGFEGEGPSSILVNGVDHTIAGVGALEDLALDNLGTVRAEGGTLLMTAVGTTGNGRFEVANGATLQLQSASHIDGGALAGEGGTLLGVGAGSGIANVGLSGDLKLGGGLSSSLAIAGNVVNDATLTFVLDGTDHLGGIVDQRLFIADGTPASLGGSGRLVLNGLETGLEGEGGGSVLSHGTGHTVEGVGTVESLTLLNAGTLRASGGELRFNDVRVDGDGFGRLESVAGSTLRLQSGTVVRSNTIGGSGGTLIGGSGGARLEYVTLEGSLLLGGGASSSLDLGGIIRNDGTLEFVADSSDTVGGVIDQRLFIVEGETVELAGNGELAFTGSETGIESSGSGATLLHQAGHTLGGRGRLARLTLGNEGRIRVYGGELVLDAATVQGSASGVVDIAADGTLRLQNGAGVLGNRVIGAGGRLVGGPGAARIGGGAVVEGSLVLGGVGSSTSLTVDGTLVNDAQLGFAADSADTVGGVLDQRLHVAAGTTATLAGSGRLTLNGTQTGIEGSGPGSVLVNQAGHTVAGPGVIRNVEFTNQGRVLVEHAGTVLRIDAVSFENQGEVRVTGSAGLLNVGNYVQTAGLTQVDTLLTLSGGSLLLQGGVLAGNGTVAGAVVQTGGVVGPGASPGELTITGNFDQGAGGTLLIELAGTGAGLFDVVDVGGNAVLDGALDIDLVDGFAPTLGDSFDVLFADTISGQLLSVAQVQGGNFLFDITTVNQGARQALRLTAAAEVAPVPLPGAAWLLAPAAVLLLRRRRAGR